VQLLAVAEEMLEGEIAYRRGEHDAAFDRLRAAKRAFRVRRQWERGRSWSSPRASSPPMRPSAASPIDRIATSSGVGSIPPLARFHVEAVLWEREPLVATRHFQDPENIPEPRGTDIVVVILWSRLA
jgi:hypothetical protein